MPSPSDLRDLFEQATALPAEARAEFLRARVTDPELQSQLAALLLADAATDCVFDTPAAELVERLDRSGTTTELIGSRVGPFQLTGLLGEGGSSVVFRAERAIGDARQQVAVKLLRTGLYSVEAQRRFGQEQAILAQLSHPNIAHLIEGGVTEAGIPYLVMELVAGLPITRHAAERRLDLRARLRLVVVVCRAVAAAHRALIVHRDLKPSNILVTGDGTVKLLDFGIAKLLDDGVSGASDTTRTGQTALTPGYGAPEQYSGGAISTATDVYALGVLLYELLLGERPTPGRALRPSGHATAGAPVARAALKGDIDNIVLKAMAEEPSQRYAGASELADDIERHLDARPVVAHPPSSWYRARKFVRRHRGGVALSAALVVAVLASLGATLWQAQIARSQAQRAAEIQSFLEDLFEPIEHGRVAGQVPSLQELLERGVRRIDQRHPDNPMIRADLLAMFARINDAIGETASNLELAETAWRANAVAYGDGDSRTLAARSLYARVLRKLGRYEPARIEYEAVRDAMRARQLRGNAYARVLDAISILRMEQGIPGDEAVALKLEVLREREADPTSTANDLASAYNNLGAAHQYAGDLEQALLWTRRAFELLLASQGEGRDAANVLVNIGMYLSFQGRWREAAEALAQAKDMYASVPVQRSPNLASLMIRLCAVLGDLESLDAALPACEEAVEMAREVSGETHLNHAMALTRRAGALVAAGRVDEAVEQFERARAVVHGGTADRGHLLGIIDSAQARLWWLEEDYPALRDAMMALLDPDTPAGARTGPRRAPGSPAHAALLALACHRAPAESCRKDLSATAEALLDDPRFARSMLRVPAASALAEIDLDQGRPEWAAARLEAVLAGTAVELGEVHSLRAQTLLILARAYQHLGDPERAAAARTMADAIIARLPQGHPLRR